MAKDIFGDDDSNSKKDDFGAMLEASLGGLSVRLEKGDKLEGEVISIGRDEVFLTVKGKEALIPKVEFQTLPAVGDKVTAYVLKTSDGLVMMTLKASSKALSESLEDAFDLETPVDGKVTEAVNGGFRVEIMHKLAFCPISQMDKKPITQPEEYIGKKFEFIITKFEGGGRNIVVSRRKALDMGRAELEGDFMSSQKVGDMVSGKISRIENFGAFVALDSGVEGMIHISEIGWSRLGHPSEAVKIGDLVTVKVLKIEEDDRGRLKIALSRKQASEDPWMEASQKFSVGQQIDGLIKDKPHFGWFIELCPGVVGLLPKSAAKESQDEKLLDSKKPGDRLKVQIQVINSAEKKISLSLPREDDDQSWRSEIGGQSVKGMGTLGDQFQGLFKKK